MTVWRRYISTHVPRKKVSIIGSGPAGFYTAYHLLSKSPVPLDVTIWEKLPVPFGLSRYGVAPDHPEVKNCEETFTDCARKFSSHSEKHHFEFVGGIEIGKQIKLAQLLENQDAVILSYGCNGDRYLGIPGEQGTKGVFSSRQFVNWYNGHPSVAMDPEFTNFNWSGVRNVGIIGNGNVALDIARILLSNRIDELWKHTDVSTIALNCLRKAPIHNVKIIGRRDFLHSKFTNKELREMWQLEKYGIRGNISREYFSENMFDLGSHDRAFKRRVEMCSEYLKPFDQRTKKNFKKSVPPPRTQEDRQWKLDYLKSPLKIEKDNYTNRIQSLTLSHNLLTEDNRLIVDPNGKEVTYNLDLLITSLGYAGVPLPEFSELDIAFEKGHISNEQGRVLNNDGDLFPGLYASGWIRKGSQGVIASTMQDSFEVADRVIQDLLQPPRYIYERKRTVDIDLSGTPHTTWADWEK
ncbi:NADPH-adrenodoxin reductase NDAI_0A04500 [Naumovozyma dairenensis CBS 421]|uniref:NADPH:adrenodoxin oxidoreductase, mitochondrial n=1 Tax=Naumovozyma dairenensis (strain ATCC 10597 / BCRC 20456 / CBS 421 / NBRC 0211 / NRRL Y-12639) TaxID=1071378 RepID=G0W468_NAUDC|nr:hypothetical protein NDAI_0A04500 [Naumovozyma dairenensis CBS 421]CCD22606.1 hypothetical protein NDAI_0A04500 [Naumovozyma dairenensis CBS 421]